MTYGGKKEIECQNPENQFYLRNQKDTNSYCYSCLSEKEILLARYIDLKIGYTRQYEINVIYYELTEVPNITQEEFDYTVDLMLKNAHKKRDSAYSVIVSKITSLTDDCVCNIIEYIF